MNATVYMLDQEGTDWAGEWLFANVEIARASLMGVAFPFGFDQYAEWSEPVLDPENITGEEWWVVTARWRGLSELGGGAAIQYRMLVVEGDAQPISEVLQPGHALATLRPAPGAPA